MRRNVGARGVQGRPISRRSLLLGAAAMLGAAPVACSSDPPSPSASPTPGGTRSSAQRQEVAVLGGGIAGLTAAHELIERGFGVTVYERKAVGGKARSIPVPASAAGGRRDLPGEHGFRFFPGFYSNVPDTMKRIPFGSNANGVFDNLVAASEANLSRGGSRHDFVVPTVPGALAPERAVESLLAMFEQFTDVPPHEIAIFVNRLIVFFGSCDARRTSQWENTSWWEYARADQLSEMYRVHVAESVTRNLVAARADLASTMTIGTIGEAFIHNAARRSGTGAIDRLLNGPTNEVWIDPWVSYLRARGVRFETGRSVTRFALDGARVAAAETEQGRIEADWFVLAVPHERVAALMTDELLRVDPSLAGIATLKNEWMTGIQFFLDRAVPIVAGHVSFTEAPWALTSVSQAQFWTNDISATYGDGRVREVLSVDISNWQAPGIVYRKPAQACTKEEIAFEVWAQMKDHLNGAGRSVLTDDMQLGVFLDPAITYPDTPPAPGVLMVNDEPLLINSVGSWARRPAPASRIQNLFLAGDYVQSNINLATMEGANETARRAVNALLAAAGSAAAPVRIFELYRAPEWDEMKRVDEQRLRGGLPHALDLPDLNGLGNASALNDLMKGVLGTR